MDMVELRSVVADLLEADGHGNPHFIQAVREGFWDESSWMRAARAVNARWLEMAMASVQEGGEE